MPKTVMLRQHTVIRGGDVSRSYEPATESIITECKDLPSEEKILENKPKYEVLAQKFQNLKFKKRKLKFDI